MEARFWSYAWRQWALPEAFAAILSLKDEVCRVALQDLQGLFQAATDAEMGRAQGEAGSGAYALRQEVYWLSWPLVDWLMRLLAHNHWLPLQQVLDVLLALFHRVGDSKCIEETHRIGRGKEKREQQPDVLGILGFYSLLQSENTPLSHRGLRHLAVPDAAHYTMGTPKPPIPWSKVFGKHSLLKMPPTWQACSTPHTPASGVLWGGTPSLAEHP